MYLNISVFYNQQNWHTLLDDCLAPLLTKLKQNQLLSDFKIYLERERGESINLSLSATNEQQAAQLIEQFSAGVDSYLQANPSAVKPPQFPLQRLFIDFPNNTIRYHLFLHVPFTDEDKTRIAKTLSHSILDVLGKDTIDLECLFTFYIYLVFSIVRAYNKTLTDALHYIAQLLQLPPMAWDSNYNTIVDGSTKKNYDWGALFEENEEAFQDIFKEVWEGGVEWLAPWNESLLAGQSQLPFPAILTIIQEHLGIFYSIQTTHLLLDILDKTIKEKD